MPKKVPQQSNGNVSKSVVREVLHEELKPVREEITNLRNEIKTTANTLRQEMRTTTDSLRKETTNEIKATANTLRQEIKTTADTIIEGLQEALNNTFQKYRDETLSKMSEMVAEVKTYREEQTIHQGQHDDLTGRVEKLEAIHPQGQHQI